MTNSEPNLVTERLPQRHGNDRRNNEGWKRLTIWLTPQEADTLQTLGDAWLGRAVKDLLADTMGGREQPSAPLAVTGGQAQPDPGAVPLQGKLAAAVLAERGRTIAVLFRLGMSAANIAALLHLELSEVARVLAPAPETFTLTGKPQAPDMPDQVDLMRELDTLLAQGLSGTDIARQFNTAGRRTASGAEYRGANLIRDWRRWKATAI